ncbi:MAG: corrinoid protein [Anaerolineae bacterium]|nr:corrinoid protein [Anaerolineae bacterium]
MTIINEIYQSVLDGDIEAVGAKTQSAIDDGGDIGDILNQGMIAAMTEVGRLFEEGEYFVPEMLISARAMQSGLAVLKPHLAQANVQSPGKIVIGTVKGDLHDIGKNLVSMMLEGAAFDIIDLGVDVPPDQFVSAVQEQQADIVALSALLTTTMPQMVSTIDALKAAGVRDQIKIMVGGAPITEAYAKEIGADGYAPDASRAVTLAKSLMG